MDQEHDSDQPRVRQDLQEPGSYKRVKYFTDLILWSAAAPIAYGLRLGFSEALRTQDIFMYSMAGMALKAVLLAVYGLHRQSWRRVGVRDLQALAFAILVGMVMLLALAFVTFTNIFVPRSVPVIEGLVAVVFLGGIRLSLRLYHERKHRFLGGNDMRRVLIVGAGEAGTLIAREMLRHPEARLVPVGFLDDNDRKQGRYVMGLRVLGSVQDLESVARRLRPDEVLIAVPSANGNFVRQVIDLAGRAGLSYRIMPSVLELLSSGVSIASIRDVNLEDLLRRDPVKLNTQEIAHYIHNQVVMVTGAGGSIGAEVVRQIVNYSPRRVILLGRGENSIFAIQQELARNWPEINVTCVIADVRDENRMRLIFQEQLPTVVFHAAAHKHVPLMEANPAEAILNNIVGTKNICELCLAFGVSRLVNISTDKAVNPTSVMGASKRVAEMVVSGFSKRASEGSAFVSVRFGNVLGSRGSVVPTFLAQIRAGGPITVTHPEMRRYFMTIPEAARLVLQAGGLAQNGSVYVLNMGEPIRIADLARDVIRLSAAQNIDIVYSGVRPGEKLYEELLTSSEDVAATRHEDIFSARLGMVEEAWVVQQVAELARLAQRNESQAIRRYLRRIIPENHFDELV